MNMDVNSHPFYKPLWRRVTIIATTAIWFGVELWSNDGMWTVIAAAFFGYSVWAFLITYPKTPAT